MIEPKTTSPESCEPCKTALAALGPQELAAMASTLPPGWSIVDNHHLQCELRCKTFKQAFQLSTLVAAVAEEQGHHPVICTQWGLVTIRSHTNKVNGLTDRDFVLARAIDAALRAAPPSSSPRS